MVVVDFDGTIVDVGMKYKYTFGVVTGLGLSFQENFWNAKKAGLSYDVILEMIPEIAVSKDDFLRVWRSEIETENALSYDSLDPKTLGALTKIAASEDLLLCTARQNESMLRQELEILGIERYFSGVLVTKQKTSKYNIIKKFVDDNRIVIENIDWFVGDTPEDVLTGQALGIRTCAVLSGLTPEKNFRVMSPSPDLVAENLAEFSHEMR
jgi:phosphoglycolate phosphatase-like HAD superfamily hydrolase